MTTLTLTLRQKYAMILRQIHGKLESFGLTSDF